MQAKGTANCRPLCSTYVNVQRTTGPLNLVATEDKSFKQHETPPRS